MAENIGSVYVEVQPELSSNFGSEIAKQGGTHGNTYGTSFSDRMKGAMGAGMVALGTMLASFVQQAAQAIGQFLGDTLQVGMSFDASMSQVAATMGVSVDQIQNLTEYAQEMGASTAFSATQASEALNYMALAGYSVEESMAALPNVLNLAAAGNIDLARASDMVTDAQSALGMSFDELEGFIDQLAVTASTTNTSVEQLGDAILTVGGTSKMLSGGTRELNQALGILADNGLKGSEGGTMLRNVLLSLAAPTSAASSMLEELGVQVYDAEGNMRSLEDIMGDFNAALDGMTSEQRTNAISSIFNTRDIKAVEALLGTTAERWDEVGAAIDSAHGAAQRMADTQLDNLQGDVTMFQSALEGLQITLFHQVEPALRAVVGAATEGLTAITQFFSGGGVNDLFADLGGVWEDIQAIAQTVWPTIQTIIFGVVDAIKTFFSATWPIISRAVTTAFDVVRGITETVWPLVQSIVEGVIGRIKFVIEGLQPIIGIVVGIFDAVKSAIETPINAARDIVKGAIDRIKGFFEFKIQWPHIPLPHFSISGSVNPLDWLRQGPPSIGIEWYAKGGIIDEPTLIGAGEAGREAIVPLTEPNIAPFADAVADRLNGGGAININEMTVVTQNPEDFMRQLTAFAARTRAQYA